MATNKAIANQALIKSSVSIRKIGESMAAFNGAIRSSVSSSRDLARSSDKSVRFKNKLITNDAKYFRKRRESVLRRQREDIIEASTTGGAIQRAGKIRTTSTKGFLGRILDFFGIIFIGWGIKNLPNIIKGADDLRKRMTNLYTNLVDYKDNLLATMGKWRDDLFSVDKSLKDIKFEEEVQGLEDELKDSSEQFSKIDRDALNIFSMFNNPRELGFGIFPDWTWMGKPDPNPPDPLTVPGSESNNDSNDVQTYNTGGVVGERSSSDFSGIVKSKGAFAVDNIPVKLTAGEYVIPRPIVNDLGIEFFDTLKDMLYDPSLKNINITKPIKQVFKKESIGNFADSFNNRFLLEIDELKSTLENMTMEDIPIPLPSEALEISPKEVLNEIETVVPSKIKSTIENLENFIDTKKSKNIIFMPVSSNNGGSGVNISIDSGDSEVTIDPQLNIMKMLQELNLA